MSDTDKAWLEEINIWKGWCIKAPKYKFDGADVLKLITRLEEALQKIERLELDNELLREGIDPKIAHKKTLAMLNVMEENEKLTAEVELVRDHLFGKKCQVEGLTDELDLTLKELEALRTPKTCENCVKGDECSTLLTMKEFHPAGWGVEDIKEWGCTDHEAKGGEG